MKERCAWIHKKSLPCPEQRALAVPGGQSVLGKAMIKCCACLCRRLYEESWPGRILSRRRRERLGCRHRYWCGELSRGPAGCFWGWPEPGRKRAVWAVRAGRAAGAVRRWSGSRRVSGGDRHWRCKPSRGSEGILSTGDSHLLSIYLKAAGFLPGHSLQQGRVSGLGLALAIRKRLNPFQPSTSTPACLLAATACRCFAACGSTSGSQRYRHK